MGSEQSSTNKRFYPSNRSLESSDQGEIAIINRQRDDNFVKKIEF